jgi:exopolysaccharide biosynthesis polyprenyl glycosylphosphotransferase
VNGTERAALLEGVARYDELTAAVDERTLEIVDRRRRTAVIKGRGWLVRRMLLAADVVGISLAFLLAQLILGPSASAEGIAVETEYLLFLATLPGWVVLAKLYGLYDRDEERTDHSTIDDLVGVFHLMTIGGWMFLAAAWVTNLAQPSMQKLLLFWAVAVPLTMITRACARLLSRRSIAYLQNTIIVGAGEVGQLVARKLLRHPEYGLNLVGFVDDERRRLEQGLEHLAVLGNHDRLVSIIRMLEIERVIVAFSNDAHEETLELVRSLKRLDVQVDIVPRLFDVVGPRVGIHHIEGLPLVGLPPARLPRSSRLIKRGVDIVGALAGLVLSAPFFAYAAWRIRRESPGPILFRQKRLGLNMQEFTALKFRTMRVDTDEGPHRALIARIMDRAASPNEEGLFKLEAGAAVTPFGRWLRATSLDELPQLINVLRGEMSLVGPRPCIPYEVEHFHPHHYERFLVPAGITGLWQVTARAHSTFREALDMDAAYVHSWSLRLDLWLLLRTPFRTLGRRSTA